MDKETTMKNEDLMLTEGEITDAVKHIQYSIPGWWLEIIKLELQAQLSKILKAGYKGPGEIEGEIQEAKKQERSAVVEEIKELCIPLDLISNNKGIALTFADLELLKSTNKGGGE